MTEQGDEQKYFDLHTEGVAYLNRYRLAPSKGGDYPCVKIVALAGKKESPDRITFDARVTAEEAKALCAQYEGEINDYDTAVLVGFRVDGANPRIWVPSKGKSAGEQLVDLKCRLIKLRWIKIRKKGEQSFSMVFNSGEADEQETADTHRKEAA